VISKNLKLLTNLLFDVSVVGVKIAQALFERVNILKPKFVSSDHFYAFHDFY